MIGCLALGRVCGVRPSKPELASSHQEYPDRVRALFKQNALSEDGRYDVRLYDPTSEEWKAVGANGLGVVPPVDKEHCAIFG